MFKFVTENSEHLRDAAAVGFVVWLTWLVARHGSVWVWTKATSAWSSLVGDFSGVSTRLSTLEADVAWLKSYFEPAPVTPAPAKPVVPAPVKPVVVAPAPVVKPVPVAPAPAPAPVAPAPAPVVVAPAPVPAPVAPVVVPVAPLSPVKEPVEREHERKEPATVKPA